MRRSSSRRACSAAAALPSRHPSYSAACCAAARLSACSHASRSRRSCTWASSASLSTCAGMGAEPGGVRGWCCSEAVPEVQAQTAVGGGGGGSSGPRLTRRRVLQAAGPHKLTPIMRSRSFCILARRWGSLLGTTGLPMAAGRFCNLRRSINSPQKLHWAFKAPRQNQNPHDAPCAASPLKTSCNDAWRSDRIINKQLKTRGAPHTPASAPCKLDPRLCAPPRLPSRPSRPLTGHDRHPDAIRHGTGHRRPPLRLGGAACSPSPCRYCGSPGAAATRAAATPRVSSLRSCKRKRSPVYGCGSN